MIDSGLQDRLAVAALQRQLNDLAHQLAASNSRLTLAGERIINSYVDGLEEGRKQLATSQETADQQRHEIRGLNYEIEARNKQLAEAVGLLREASKYDAAIEVWQRVSAYLAKHS